MWPHVRPRWTSRFRRMPIATCMPKPWKSRRDRIRGSESPLRRGTTCRIRTGGTLIALTTSAALFAARSAVLGSVVTRPTRIRRWRGTYLIFGPLCACAARKSIVGNWRRKPILSTMSIRICALSDPWWRELLAASAVDVYGGMALPSRRRMAPSQWGMDLRFRSQERCDHT